MTPHQEDDLRRFQRQRSGHAVSTLEEGEKLKREYNEMGRPPVFDNYETSQTKKKAQSITPEQIEAGLRKFDASSPLLQFTDELAEAANRMPKKADRWLPVVMAIMETHAGKKLSAENNPYNLRGQQGGKSKFIDYPDMRVSILGGDNNGTPAKGFVGQINEAPFYQRFRETGDIKDFFEKFTPPGKEYGNPSMEELVSRYDSIKRDYFDQETQQPSVRIIDQPPVIDDKRKKELERRARFY